MFSKRFLRTTLGFLSLGAGLLSSCGDSGDYAILVHVNGSPTDTASLYATAKLGGTLAMQGMDITTQLDSIGIRLPADKSGILTLDISALGMDQCKSATGSVTIDLSKGRGQEVTVNLSVLSPRRCSLLLSQSGEGSVSLTSTGTSCGNGCYDYNQGDTVLLRFAPTGKSYGAQTFVSAGGVCDGVNDCSVKMDRRVQVDAKFQPRLCLSKWCWLHPLPQGNALLGMWGTGPSDIWAVGDGGTALHYDGQTWALQNTGTKTNLNGVYAPAAGVAVIVGDSGLVLRWNGSTFASEPSGTLSNLNSVWGASGSNVFAVGDTGTIIRNMGSGWVPMSSGTTNNLYRVSGSAADNVWAVGQSGTVRSYAGTSWNTVAGPSTAPIADVYTSGPSDVWVVGGTTSSDCGLGRWNGTAWATSNTCKSGLTALWGNGASEVWFGGAEKVVTRIVNGDLTKPLTSDILGPGITKTPTYTSAWGPAAGEVYLTTSGGTIVRTVAATGGTQLLAPFSTLAPNGGAATLRAITGSGGTQYILYSDGTTWSYDGRKFTQLPNPTPGSFFDAWAAPNGDLFVGTDSGYVLPFSKNTWSALNLTSTSSNVTAVGGFSHLDFYVGTALGYLYRFQNGTAPGGSLNGTAFSGGIQSIWSRSATEAWAVGLSGTVVRINGNATTAITSAASMAGTNALYSVHGAAAPNKYVWMVGANGTVLRYDTALLSWSKFTTSPATTTALTSVVALSDSDVWISGDAGVMLHWDGSTLTPSTGPFGTRNLTEMYAPSATEIWLAGSGNSVWRYQM